jgi:hypothetical protein
MKIIFHDDAIAVLNDKYLTRYYLGKGDELGFASYLIKELDDDDLENYQGHSQTSHEAYRRITKLLSINQSITLILTIVKAYKNIWSDMPSLLYKEVFKDASLF